MKKPTTFKLLSKWRIDVEMGNNESQVNEYKELSCKLFQFQTYRVSCSNGDFGRPFSDYKAQNENRYIHFLKHAILSGWGDPPRPKSKSETIFHHVQIYQAIDLAHTVKAEAEQISWVEDSKGPFPHSYLRLADWVHISILNWFCAGRDGCCR